MLSDDKCDLECNNYADNYDNGDCRSVNMDFPVYISDVKSKGTNGTKYKLEQDAPLNIVNGSYVLSQPYENTI